MINYDQSGIRECDRYCGKLANPSMCWEKGIFIDPLKAQEDLGLTKKIFWFAIFTLIEQQKINISELPYVAIYPAAIVLSKHQGSINER